MTKLFDFAIFIDILIIIQQIVSLVVKILKDLTLNLAI